MKTTENDKRFAALLNPRTYQAAIEGATPEDMVETLKPRYLATILALIAASFAKNMAAIHEALKHREDLAINFKCRISPKKIGVEIAFSPMPRFSESCLIECDEIEGQPDLGAIRDQSFAPTNFPKLEK